MCNLTNCSCSTKKQYVKNILGGWDLKIMNYAPVPLKVFEKNYKASFRIQVNIFMQRLISRYNF